MKYETKLRLSYWVITVLFCLPMTAGGVAELIELPPATKMLNALQFPTYMLPFLGLAKLLGVAAVLYGKFQSLKEWAYAGFAFTLLGASFAHYSVGQTREALSPLVMAAVVSASYYLWLRIRTQQLYAKS